MSKKAALNLILEISKFTGAILVIIFGLVFAQAAKTAMAQTIITVDLKIDGQNGTPGPVTVNEGSTMKVTWDVTPTGLSPINCPASGFAKVSGAPFTFWSGPKSYPTGSETFPVPAESGSLRLACSISATEGGYDEVFFNVVKPTTTVELFANDQRSTLTLSAPGNVTLRWTTSNSPYLCQGDWKPGALLDINGGTDTVMVNVSTTYTITCQRLGSPDSSSSVSVVIGEPPPLPIFRGQYTSVKPCTSYGDIVVEVNFLYMPKPPAIANLMHIKEGSRNGPLVAVIDPWPAPTVKVSGIFVPGNTYFFQGFLIDPSGTPTVDDPPASVTIDASIPPCIGAPPPPPPPPPPPLVVQTPDCSEPEQTQQFTKVSIEPAPEHIFPLTYTDLAPGSIVTINKTLKPELHVPVNEDLSNLPAVFANSNSNYLESNFQDQTHRGENIIGLNSQDFNEYHKAGQKAAPIYMTDDLRMNYVAYIGGKPAIKEAVNTYADYNGANPQTVAQLVTAYGQPNPPSHGGDQAAWDAGWGMYWSKIPTAVNEFYLGHIDYGFAVGNNEWQRLIDPNATVRYCAYPRRQFFFNMPDYFRNTSVANQINQLMVPKAAQSSYADFAQNPNAPRAEIEESQPIVEKNIERNTDNNIFSAIKKLLKISYDFVKPSTVYAQFGQEGDGGTSECPLPVPMLPNDKAGSGPYCKLLVNIPRKAAGEPTENLNPANGDTCTDQIHCRIYVDFPTTMLKVPDVNGVGGSDRWDSCSPNLDANGVVVSYNCTVTIRLYRVYYFPWLATIWNNSTFSDKADSIAILGSGLTGPAQQETGRPGVFGFSTPNAADSVVHPVGKNLPGAEAAATGTDTIRQRFGGAVNCAMNFMRDNAFKPMALQLSLGITLGCPWR